MKESTLLSMRTVVDRHGHALQEVVLPGLRDVTINESITRRRADKIEARLDAFEHWQGFSTFWDRLRWLLTGYVPTTTVEMTVEQGVNENFIIEGAEPVDPIEAKCGCAPLVN